MGEKIENEERHSYPVFTTMVIIGMLIAFFTLQYPKIRLDPFESNAKRTLHTIGSSQLAYQGTNNMKNYGSFEALRRNGYIAEDNTLGNMIEKYSMTWKVYIDPRKANFPAGDGPSSDAFTIVAFPRDRRPGILGTFGKTEDQEVRKFTPEKRNKFDSVTSWDPIL